MVVVGVDVEREEEEELDGSEGDAGNSGEERSGMAG